VDYKDRYDKRKGKKSRWREMRRGWERNTGESKEYDNVCKRKKNKEGV
jgi:hypothetical protein